MALNGTTDAPFAIKKDVMYIRIWKSVGDVQAVENEIRHLHSRSASVVNPAPDRDSDHHDGIKITKVVLDLHYHFYAYADASVEMDEITEKTLGLLKLIRSLYPNINEIEVKGMDVPMKLFYFVLGKFTKVIGFFLKLIILNTDQPENLIKEYFHHDGSTTSASASASITQAHHKIFDPQIEVFDAQNDATYSMCPVEAWARWILPVHSNVRSIDLHFYNFNMQYTLTHLLAMKRNYACILQAPHLSEISFTNRDTPDNHGWVVALSLALAVTPNIGRNLKTVTINTVCGPLLDRAFLDVHHPNPKEFKLRLQLSNSVQVPVQARQTVANIVKGCKWTTNVSFEIYDIFENLHPAPMPLIVDAVKRNYTLTDVAFDFGLWRNGQNELDDKDKALIDMYARLSRNGVRKALDDNPYNDDVRKTALANMSYAKHDDNLNDEFIERIYVNCIHSLVKGNPVFLVNGSSNDRAQGVPEPQKRKLPVECDKSNESKKKQKKTTTN